MPSHEKSIIKKRKWKKTQKYGGTRPKHKWYIGRLYLLIKNSNIRLWLLGIILNNDKPISVGVKENESWKWDSEFSMILFKKESKPHKKI